ALPNALVGVSASRVQTVLRNGGEDRAVLVRNVNGLAVRQPDLLRPAIQGPHAVGCAKYKRHRPVLPRQCLTTDRNSAGQQPSELPAVWPVPERTRGITIKAEVVSFPARHSRRQAFRAGVRQTSLTNGANCARYRLAIRTTEHGV